MKIKISIYLLSLLMLCSLNAVSQSFDIPETEINVRGKVGETLKTPIIIKNLSGKEIPLVIERAQNNISNGQSTLICWDKECTEISSLHKTLTTGKIKPQVFVSMDAGLSGGISSVKYLVYNKNNPQDAVYVTIHYTIEEPVEDIEIYNSEKIRIKDVYPNPVSDFLTISYNLVDLNANAKIGIHNVLGSVVSEFMLEPFETTATINTTELNPGVYFYSLSVNNETVLIKKFLVRK